MKKITRKLVAFGCTMAMMLSMGASAFAADISKPAENTVVPVPVTMAATTFNVTVPTNLPVSINGAGVVTSANTAKITNNGYGAVKVTEVTIAPAASWAVVAWDSVMTEKKVNTKEIAFTINNQKTVAGALDAFNATNFPKLDGVNASASDELAITYNAKVPAQAAVVSAVDAANVTFVIGWDSIK